MKSLTTVLLASATLAFSLASVAQTAATSVDTVDSASSLRYGVMGVPAGAHGEAPSIEPQPYDQWIVGFDAENNPVQWQRVPMSEHESAAEAITTITLELAIDAEAPNASLSFTGDAIEREGQQAVSPRAVLSIKSDDLSGVDNTTLLVDQQPAANPDDWAEHRADGHHLLSVHAQDALGNAGERGALEVMLDSTPPTLTWERLDARAGVATDIFDGKRAHVSISVADAAAGVRELQLGGSRYNERELAAQPIQLKVDANTLDYTLSDRVNNVATGSIALRADIEGPTLVAIRNGELLDINGATLKRSDSLTLRADDALAGVARACVEASIWYGKCTELPVDIVGIAPGRYALEFRAADRLGNKTFTRLSMEVVP